MKRTILPDLVCCVLFASLAGLLFAFLQRAFP